MKVQVNAAPSEKSVLSRCGEGRRGREEQNGFCTRSRFKQKGKWGEEVLSSEEKEFSGFRSFLPYISVVFRMPPSSLPLREIRGAASADRINAVSPLPQILSTSKNAAAAKRRSNLGPFLLLCPWGKEKKTCRKCTSFLSGKYREIETCFLQSI